MFDDIRMIADQVGWHIAMCFFLSIIGDRMGLLSIKKNKEGDAQYIVDCCSTK